VAMMFCQIGQAQLLREICGRLASCFGKARHLSIKEAPKRSTLVYANEHRPWLLYEKLLYHLLGRCRQLEYDKRKFRFKNRLFSLDASLIPLCDSWTALIAILVLKYLKHRSQFKWSLSNLVAMLQYSLFTYRDL